MRARTSRSRPRSLLLGAAFCLAASCAREQPREPAATIWPEGLEVSTRAQWMQDLGYAETDTRPLTLSRSTGCPSIRGAVGLDFFAGRRLTLDYISRTAAVSAAALPVAPDPGRYLSLDLVEPPARQGHILYVRATVNGQPALVYLDTGYSASWIDPRFAGNLERSERPRGLGFRRSGIPLEFGGRHFVLDDVREQAIDRGAGLDSPVALVLGSDVLRSFVVTIDLRAKKLLLALAG